MSTSRTVGIFVGGASRRMGGHPKGLVTTANGEAVIERVVRVAREAFPDAEVVLVGRAEAYDHLRLPALRDDPPGIGPLGGLAALLTRGAPSQGSVIALACDLPKLTPTLLRRLVPPEEADAIAPKTDGIWQPLVAGYRAEPCLEVARAALADGQCALFEVLNRLGDRAHALQLDPNDQDALRDWDAPDDVTREGGRIPADPDHA